MKSEIPQPIATCMNLILGFLLASLCATAIGFFVHTFWLWAEVGWHLAGKLWNH